jgi:hypothetical protein
VHDLWTVEYHVSDEENLALQLSYLPKELDLVIKEMKTDMALGPDGFLVDLFKLFLLFLKILLLHILNGFALGMTDISHLNFGVLSLIPKLTG